MAILTVRPRTRACHLIERSTIDYKPDVELVLEAFDDYWGGRPPIKRLRFVEVPEVASRVNGLRSGDFDFACDMPPDQIVRDRVQPEA